MIKLKCNSDLAIVIPAYKDTFFYECLFSIANQTNDKFTVYIGDDNSPYDLYKIVEQFENKIKIVYKKFDDNIGGTNLVAQWHRCIDMIEDEKWIWLFSDDDIMDSNCVDEFFKYKEKYNDQIFHFNVKVIDSKSKILYNIDKFPDKIYSTDLIYLKMKGNLCSYVVEYVFSRELYEAKGKFEYFDLAWGSDDATWVKFLGNKSLRTIETAFVNWRFSELNISSGNGDIVFVNRKINASLSYLKWVNHFFERYGLPDKTSKYLKIKWMLEVVKASQLSIFIKIKLTSYITEKLQANKGLKFFFIFFTLYSAIKTSFTKQIKKLK